MKKNNFINFLLIVFTIILNTFVYRVGRLFPYRATIVGTSLDLEIPYVGWFIYFYISWYILIFLIPYLVSFYDKKVFYKYITMITISLFISLIIYLLFPTQMIRYNLDLLTLSFTDRLVALIYKLGSTLACIPSLHVLLASGYAIPLFKAKIPKWLKYLGVITSFLIVISTLLVKQHIIYDVISAITINIIVWFFVNKYNLQSKLEKIVSNFSK